MTAPYERTYSIRYNETGPDGRLRPDALCNLLQDAATLHAADLGVGMTALLERGLTWVLAKLEVRVSGYPQWNEEVLLQTWPAAVERAFAVRDFRLRTTQHGEIATASSAWLLLDAATKRPLRLLPEIKSLHGSPALMRALGTDFSGTLAPAGGDNVRSIAAAYSDLDLNHHANNAAVIRWLLNSIDGNIQSAFSIAALQLEFRGEAALEERLVIVTEQEPPYSDACTVRQSIYTEDRERAIVHALSVWRRQ